TPPVTPPVTPPANNGGSTGTTPPVTSTGNTETPAPGSSGIPLTGSVTPGLPLIPTVLVGTLAGSSSAASISSIVSNVSTGQTGGTVPSSVLLGLGTGPLSGVATPISPESANRTDVYDRVLGQTPGLAFVGTAVRLPILLQSGESGTSQSGSGGNDLLSVLQAIMHTLSKTSWVEAVDLFHSDGEPTARPASLETGDGATSGDFAFPENEEPDPSIWLLTDVRETTGADAAGTLALAGTAVLGLAAPVRTGEKRNLQPPRWRGRYVERA